MNKKNTAVAAPQPVEVEIEKLVYGGDGLARVQGQVMLTPFVLPGEQVRVVPRRASGGLLRGHKPTVVNPSGERVVPPCPYFGPCGGCQYQHIDYPFQLRQKEAILRETLRRIGRIEFEQPIAVISGEPWGYRNRIQLHFDGPRVGFRSLGSHALQAIDHCPIASPALQEAIAAIARAVKEPPWPRFLQTLELFTNESELQVHVTDSSRPIAARFFEWCQTFLPAMIGGPLTYRATGYDFAIGRSSFFQVNRFLIDALVREALGERSGGTAVDLYAGVGLFSLPMTERFQKVHAVERGKSAQRDLQANSAQVDADRLRVYEDTAENFLLGCTEKTDLVIADPPRSGLGTEVTTELLRLQPEHLVLVSCDPTTLSRDLQRLQTAFTIERITLVDLFPQTFHLETVAHLRRS